MSQWLRAFFPLLEVANARGLNSQHLHGGSQPSITPVLGNMIASSGLCEYVACKWCTNIEVGKTSIHINNT